MINFPDSETRRYISQANDELSFIYNFYQSKNILDRYPLILKAWSIIQIILPIINSAYDHSVAIQLSPATHDDIREKAENLFKLCSERNIATMHQASPDALEQEIISNAENLYALVQPHLNTLNLWTLSAITERRQNESFINIQKELADLKKGLVNNHTTMSSVQEDVIRLQEKKADQAIDIVFKEFASLNKSHEYQSLFWATSTMILFIFLGFVFYALSSSHGYELLVPHNLRGIEGNKTQAIWLYLTSKTFFYAITFYLIITCVKNYARSKHNEIIFGHRSACMKAIGTLLSAISDGKARDIILSEASEAIFSHADTGYINSKTNNENVHDTNVPLQLINLANAQDSKA